MSSHIHAEQSRGRQLEITAECAHAQCERQLRDANERPRRFRSTGRRRAAAVAIGLAVASAGVACGAVTHASQSGAAATMSIAPASASPVRAPHASASPQAFAVAIRKLETQGYAEAACTLRGMLMVNPRTHRSETVLIAHPVPNSRRSAVVRSRVTRERASASSAGGFSQSVHASQSDTPVLSLAALRNVRLSSANATSVIAPG